VKFRRPSRGNPRRAAQGEQGVVIMLVAVFMLFVVGAMAALSIDVVTIYTAKSEAQLVADSAALAGARTLANSGATTDPTDLLAGAELLAQSVAIQVGQSSPVGGRTLIAANGEITVNFVTTIPGDPLVTVHVQRTDLPTFFARIWGNRQIPVSASATAEAYNPSSVGGTTATTSPAIAPTCVKPWLLPNVSPRPGALGGPIFVPSTGAISDTSLIGWSSNSIPAAPVPLSLTSSCPDSGCVLPSTVVTTWNYFPGDDATTFQHPTHSLPSCTPPLITSYQESVAGCIPLPLACNATANIDMTSYPGVRNVDTAEAVNCLTHSTNNSGDTVTSTGAPPTAPFEFIAGSDNPITGTSGSNVMVSDSLVTVPVFDSSAGVPTQNVQIIGFVQLFLNPDGDATPTTGLVNTTVINMVGCGTGPTPGTVINGNGNSPVAVRLVSQ
jgi:hypothetical protein